MKTAQAIVERNGEIAKKNENLFCLLLPAGDASQYDVFLTVTVMPSYVM